MSETYQIIMDEEKVKKFIDWLPDIDVHEKFYACLFMRKKYCPDVPWIKSDKGQLKRILSDKERLLQKIKQLECKFGAYQYDGNSTPQESLALYITPNPRDVWKATFKSITAIAKLLECQSKSANPAQEVMSEIQKTPGNRKYILFDLDWKDDKKLNECIDLVDGKCDVIETRGGYHLHVHKADVGKITEKKWYPELAKVADVAGDNMTPVVGTYQGGFMPDFIYRKQDD